MTQPPTRAALSLVLAATVSAGAFAQVPQGFPPPPAPTRNPITADKAMLGKALFWDEQLSSTDTVACGTCHVFASGGGDPRVSAANARHPGRDGILGTADDVAGSPGVIRSLANGHYVRDAVFDLEPRVTRRKAPSVINAGYARSLFWDGRAPTTPFRDPITNALTLGIHSALESVAVEPPVDAIEMGHQGRTWVDVEAKIRGVAPLALASNLPPDVATFIGSDAYPALFQRAFGSPGVTASRTAMAIATYVRTLVSDESRFDRMLEGSATFTPEEVAGRQTFDNNCAICHADVHVFSHFNGPATAVFEFSNTGVRPLFEDLGAGNGQFKIPFLRNVELRAPFFHNGGMDTLDEVVEFYDRGGDFRSGISQFVQPLNLTQTERDDLVAFLRTLTDPRVAQELPPFDRPTLYSESTRRPTFFGAGSPGSGGFVPRAIAIEPPALGNDSMTVGVDNTRPGALAVLLWDSVADPVGTRTMGANLHLARSQDFVAISMPTLTSGAAPGTGYTSVSIPIPRAPALAGVVQYGQWAILDPHPAGALAASEGFRVALF